MVCSSRAQWWGPAVSPGETAVYLLACWFHRAHQKEEGAELRGRHGGCPETGLSEEGAPCLGQNKPPPPEFSQKKRALPGVSAGSREVAEAGSSGLTPPLDRAGEQRSKGHFREMRKSRETVADNPTTYTTKRFSEGTSSTLVATWCHSTW